MMKMKYKIPTALTMALAMAIALLQACKKDLGNYSYSNLNQVQIAASSGDTFSVRLHDTLSINVDISQTTSSNNLSYHWYLTQSSSSSPNPPQFLLDSNQNLHAVISVPLGFYNVIDKVTDQKTGVSFYKYFYLQVIPGIQASEGWLVLQDQSAGSNGNDISIILSRDGSTHGVVYNNLYAGANSHKLPVGTNSMYVINYASALAMQKLAFVYPGGGLQIRATDYTDSSNSNAWFFLAPEVTNIQNDAIAAQGQREWLINNNQFSYQVLNPTSIKTPPILFGVPVMGSWTISPYIMQYSGLGDSYFMMYDTANGCFFGVNVSTNTMVGGLPDVPNAHFAKFAGTAASLLATGTGFDMNNVGKSMVYAENMQQLTSTSSAGLVWDCIFRSKTQDSTYVIQLPITTAYTNNYTTGRYYLDSAKCPGILSATLFAVPTYLSAPGAFYYVNGSNIYTCTISTTQGASSASVGYSFPNGTIIKAMRLFKSEYSGTSNAPKTPLPANDGKVLVVATDETANGGGNNVYFFNLGTGGAITYADKYTGFDKILDIRFKKQIGL